ncbi:LysR family transcriptional regulator [Pseudomonas sp. BAY1663]|uniref:substrate-binding domain-containing protein n=1 Tax=Pseudomonadaceae TaxID=135621 RepID=UPI00042DFB52|nr:MULTISPECIES: substrate-binding domain-containing protein [Pseudomonadaceae]EXF47500.1 LysR family transcriptional regulator [Pseudomonas sp. BAY1663]
MFKRNMIAASLAVAGLCSAQAMAAVVGGGATLPEELYQQSGVLSSGFTPYVGTGSGTGKNAFFNNNGSLFGQPGATVDYAGSDSIVSQSELSGYNSQSAALYGPLVQLPSAATSVTVPFNVAGLSELDLTSQQLADIFAGRITDWSDESLDLGITGPRPITVVYRIDGSGTTEIFVNHLHAVDDTAVVNVSNNFLAAFDIDLQNPPAGSTYVGGNGSNGVVAQVNAIDGAIGYVSPDKVDFDNPAEVARVNGLLPSEVNVVAALNSISLPVGGAAGDPLAWAPAAQLANPSAGYSIVGVTNLIFSQCYQDTAAGGDLANIRDFLARHYNANPAASNDAAISAHSLIPLPTAWKAVVRNNFVTNQTGNGLDVGNTSVCNGIGRPL